MYWSCYGNTITNGMNHHWYIFKHVNTVASCMNYDWDMEIQKHGQMKTQGSNPLVQFLVSKDLHII